MARFPSQSLLLELLGLVTPLCTIWLSFGRSLDFLLSRSLELLGFIPGPPTALAAQVAGAGRRLTAVAPLRRQGLRLLPGRFRRCLECR